MTTKADVTKLVDELYAKLFALREAAYAMVVEQYAAKPGSFAWAVEQMRAGKKVNRLGMGWACWIGVDGRLCGGQYLGITENFFATDWELYTEPQQGHNWSWAWEQLKVGKRVRRLCWVKDLWWKLNGDGVCIHGTEAVYMYRPCLDANDWVLAEDGDDQV